MKTIIKLIGTAYLLFCLACVLASDADAGSGIETPAVIKGTDGQTLGSITTDGKFQGFGTKKSLSGTNSIDEAADGTDRQGMTDHGVSLFLNASDAWGTFTSAVTNPDNATASISVTFDTPEGDTVLPGVPPGYEILLVTTGMTPTYGAPNGASFTLGDKYANSFEVRNPAGLSSGIGGVWFKFRTSNISP